ncbi:MAG: TadE/TadG family type IV pilus assembly protein [Kiloniellaceae bacterium]
MRRVAGVPGVRLWTARQGVAAVEFVLVLPLLLVLLALVVDAGRLLADYHAVSKSVRDATRYLSRAEGGAGGLGLDCATRSVDPASQEVRNARRLAMTGRIDGDPAREPLVAGWTATALSESATGIRISVECADNAANGLRGLYDGAARVPGVVVSASVPFRFTLGRLVRLGPSLTFTVRRKMAHTGT